MDIVPGRSCGGCTVCCVELHINSTELKKLAGMRCAHLKDDRCCAIYAMRFKICREFHCGWRVMQQLGDDWRPDRSGVVFIPKTRNNPPGYRDEAGVQIMVIRRDAIYRNELPGMIAAWVSGRAPVHLTVAAPLGYHARSAFLNDMVEGAVRRQDRSAVVKVVEEMVDSLSRQRLKAAALEAMPLN